MPVVTTPEPHVTLFGESAAILKSFLAFRNTPFIAPIVGAKADALDLEAHRRSTPEDYESETQSRHY